VSQQDQPPAAHDLGHTGMAWVAVATSFVILLIVGFRHTPLVD
jgi:hypothetical protein